MSNKQTCRWLLSLFAMVLVLLYSTPSHGQATDAEKQKVRERELERELQKHREVVQVMDSAIAHTDRGLYAQADEEYQYVLKNIRSVPSDLTYHFGRNSFHLEKYHQAIDWLNKYIQLKGTSGKYSDDAVDYLKQSEQALLEQQRQQAQYTQEVLSKDYDIDCGPSGKVTCPVCNGRTVIVKRTYLGETYKTCPYCKTLGTLNCEEYNKLVRGELLPTGK